MVKYIPHNKKLAQSESFRNALKKHKKGRTDEEYRAYLANKRPPKSPYQHALNALNSGDHGDRGYEEEQLSYQFQNNESLKKKMSDYYKNNPDYFVPDGSRVHKDQADVDAYIRMAKSGRVKAYSPEAIRKMESWGLDLSAMKPRSQKPSTPTIPKKEKPPAYQEYLDSLPQMMAPPPGERHMLFALKNRPKYNSLRDNYNHSAFGITPSSPQQQTQTGQGYQPYDFYGAIAANTSPVQMPYSNIQRYNAYQLGAPRTPYDDLVNQRTAQIQKLMGVRSPQASPNQTQSVFNRFNPNLATQNYVLGQGY